MSKGHSQLDVWAQSLAKKTSVGLDLEISLWFVKMETIKTVETNETTLDSIHMKRLEQLTWEPWCYYGHRRKADDNKVHVGHSGK